MACSTSFHYTQHSQYTWTVAVEMDLHRPGTIVSRTNWNVSTSGDELNEVRHLGLQYENTSNLSNVLIKLQINNYNNNNTSIASISLKIFKLTGVIIAWDSRK